MVDRTDDPTLKELSTMSSKTTAARARTPLPTIEATRRAIAKQVTRGVIEELAEARRAYREIWDAVDDDSSLDSFAAVATDHVAEMECQVTRAVIAWGPDASDDVNDTHLKFWHPFALKVGGRLYVAYPSPEADTDGLRVGDEGRQGKRVMYLAEVEPGRFVDLDDERPVDPAGPAVPAEEGGER